MSNYRPLTIECSKSVVKHLEIGLRLKLTQQCPSIRAIDKTLPHYVDKIEFFGDSFRINSTTYKLGVIQICKTGKTPRVLSNSNDKGGLQYDVDKYGFPLMNDGQKMTPQQDMEELTRLKQELAGMAGTRPGVGCFRDIPALERHKEREGTIRLKINAYALRLNNSEPAFNQYLHLWSYDGKREVEKVVYDKPLEEARKYLWKRIVGSKDVYVSDLVIGGDPYGGRSLRSYRNIKNTVLKTPLLALDPGKLHIRNLKITTEDVDKSLDALRPILANEPLESLEIDRGEVTDKFCQDPIVTSCKRIILAEESEVDVLTKLSNDRVHLEMAGCSHEEVTNLVEKWQQNGLKIGVEFSIGLLWMEHGSDILNSFQQMPGAETKELEEIRNTKYPNCVILPIGEFTELNVYCENMTPDEDWDWVCKIKVQPRGFAAQLNA